MTKIVYNGCFGGFSVSNAGILRGREISGDSLWGGPCLLGDVYPDTGETVDRDWGGGGRDLSRTDPVLVQVVEELGVKANGMAAELLIADLEPGTKYYIHEYDGSEDVRTPDDIDWQVA